MAWSFLKVRNETSDVYWRVKDWSGEHHERYSTFANLDYKSRLLYSVVYYTYVVVSAKEIRYL